MKYCIDCKGCLTEDICKFTRYSEACPCTICIIKMICECSCEERMNFRIDVEKEKGNI